MKTRKRNRTENGLPKSILDQLKTFDMHTILNCILVEAGARRAMLIEGTSDMNREGLRQYQLRHTKYPNAFKNWWKQRDWFLKDNNWDTKKFVAALDAFSAEHGPEEKRLFNEQTIAFLAKYYPSLKYTVIDGGILVHKQAIPNKFKNIRRYDEKGREYMKGRMDIGEFIDYPCYPGNGKSNQNLGYDLIANFNNHYPVQIFGNMHCSTQHIGDFLKLAEKYKTALENSILGKSLTDVKVQVSKY